MNQTQIPKWFQTEFKLQQKSRGCYLITDQIILKVPEIKQFRIGLMNIFLKHTSASLSLNENYDSDVQLDMEDSLSRIVKEDNKLYRHTMEGSDDMPAHIKSQLVGVSIDIPIKEGKMTLGTWQGIWLNEHRTQTHTRTVVITINGIQ